MPRLPNEQIIEPPKNSPIIQSCFCIFHICIWCSRTRLLLRLSWALLLWLARLLIFCFIRALLVCAILLTIFIMTLTTIFIAMTVSIIAVAVEFAIRLFRFFSVNTWRRCCYRGAKKAFYPIH